MFENIRRDYEVHGRSLRSRGVWALGVYRFGVWAMQRRSASARWFLGKVYGFLRFWSGLITRIALDRETQLGEDFHIIHADGSVSIHPDVVIGARCGIMHNTTLGTNMGEGVPRLGDDVFIGVGASVLGEITIGDAVHIAANTLVIQDVPSNSIAIGVPAKLYPRLPAKREKPKQPDT